MSRTAIFALLVCACGRLDFGIVPSGGGDGGVLDGVIAGDGQIDAVADGPPGLGPAFVQEGNHVGVAAANTFMATLAGPVAAGDLLLVTSTVESGGFAGITDSSGDSFQVAIAAFGWPTSPYSTKVWYAVTTAPAASLIVSLQFTTSSPIAGIYIDEYTNISASPIDTTITGTGTSASSASGNVVLTGAPEIVFGHGEVQGTTLMTGPSFTQRASVSSLAVEEDRSITTSGSYGATFMLSSTGEWIALMVAIH